MKTSDLRILTTTFPDREQAEAVTRILVDAGLAVCGQIGAEMTSVYRWQGEVHSEPEVAVVYKVLQDRFELFVGELELNHPYEVPQLLAWPADWANEAYLAWAKGQGK